jgi:hypothetical protein
MVDFNRLWVLVLGLAVWGVADAAGASKPVAPPIDLVAEVQEDRNYTSCMDCGEPLPRVSAKALFEEMINSYIACGDPDWGWTSTPHDASDACLHSSCTSFSSEATR